MSSPSVEPCPEPVPYSTTKDAYMADIDFPTSDPVVFSAKPSFIEVDSIVANQVGAVTNPVSGNTKEYNMEPVMPVVSDSNANPVLSSSTGSDINAPYTLSSSNTSDFLSINNVESFNNNKVAKPVHKSPEAKKEIANQIVESFANPVSNPVSTPVTPNAMKLSTNNNLASYITNNQPKINRTNNLKEHFGSSKNMNSNTMLIILLVFGAGVVYYMLHKDTVNNQLSQIDFSKIPILAELNDPNVSKNNKLMIIVGIVVVVFILLQVL